MTSNIPITTAQVMLCCALLLVGCQAAIKQDMEDTNGWKRLSLAELPSLRAVEVPMDVELLFERSRSELGIIRRIRIQPIVLRMFEETISVGMLRDQVHPLTSAARQIAGYCNAQGNIVVGYNLIDLNNPSCPEWVSEQWVREVIGVSSCTDLRVIELDAAC